MEALLEMRFQGSERSEALRLMECVIESSAITYAALNALYVELRIGGGFFRGRKMASDIDQRTRYELVGYITALAATLAKAASRVPHVSDSIVMGLEDLVFVPEWQAAHPPYREYMTRYREISPADPGIFPRHKVLLIRFRQMLIEIWGMSPQLLLEDRIVQRYCEALTMLHEDVQRKIVKTLSNVVENGSPLFDLSGHSHSAELS